MRPLLVAVLALLVSTSAMSAEAVYEATAPGTIEVKIVPAVTAMEAEGRGTYFETNDSTFGRLFRYIRQNDVSMTTPVEADVVQANRMRFFVGPADAAKALPSDGDVKVVSLPERRVLAAGLKGSYSPERFEKGRAALDEWLAAHPEWKATGEAYAVYWNSPFVPAFLKRSEVHVPVEPR